MAAAVIWRLGGLLKLRVWGQVKHQVICRQMHTRSQSGQGQAEGLPGGLNYFQ